MDPRQGAVVGGKFLELGEGENAVGVADLAAPFEGLGVSGGRFRVVFLDLVDLADLDEVSGGEEGEVLRSIGVLGQFGPDFVGTREVLEGLVQISPFEGLAGAQGRGLGGKAEDAG